MAVHNPNWPLIYDQLAVNVGANDPADPTWLDITDRVVTRALASGRSSEMDHTEAADNTYQIRDRDEVFNPGNTAGPYFGQLLPYRRIRTLLMWPLTGNIANSSQPFADFTGNWGQTSDFEGSGNGGWTAGGTSAPTLNGPSTDWAQHGTQSMKVTMPTAAGGQAVTAVTAPQTGPSPWGLCIGQTYTWSVYVNRPAGGMPNVRLALKSGTTLTASSGFSLTTSATGVTRLAGTFVCQDASNDVPVLFPIAATTAGQVFYYDALQVEWGVAVPSAYTTSGPTVYQPFIGFVERWPTTWDHQGLYGYVELGCTDALGAYGQTTFVDPLYHRALDDGPAALYPLTDPAGTLAAGNVAPTQQPSLLAKNIGNGGGSINFAGIDGPTGVARQVAQFIASTSNDGIVLTTGQLSSPIGGAAGVTLYGWLNVPATRGWSQPVTVCSLWNGVNDYLSLAIGTDGGLRVYAKFPGQAAETVFPAGVQQVADDGWHFAGVVVSCSGTTYTVIVVVDGVSIGTTTVTGVTNPAGPGIVGPYQTMTAFGIPKGRLFPSNGGACYIGALSYAINWPDLVNGVRRAGFDGFAGDTTAVRLQRVANWFGQSVLTAGSTSVAMQGAQVHNGKTGPDIYADISDTEGGALYVSSGFVVLQTRQARELAAVPKIVFGEDTTAGEVPYESDLRLTQDVDWVYNDITVNQANGPSVRVADQASQKAYFERDLSLEIYSEDPADAFDHASYLLFRYKDPQQRVAQLSVEAGHRGTGAWSAIANSQQPTVIQVKRRLPNGVVQSGLHRIDRVSHDADGALGWKTQIQASPLDPLAFWLLGDASRGVLGSTTIPGW